MSKNKEKSFDTQSNSKSACDNNSPLSSNILPSPNEFKIILKYKDGRIEKFDLDQNPRVEVLEIVEFSGCFQMIGIAREFSRSFNAKFSISFEVRDIKRKGNTRIYTCMEFSK